MTTWFNGYTLIGTKVHRIRMIDDDFKTKCGRYVDANIMGGNVDLTLASLNGELCKYCYRGPRQ